MLLIALTSVLLLLCLPAAVADGGPPSGDVPPAGSAHNEDGGIDLGLVHAIEAAYLLHLAVLTEWPATDAPSQAFEVAIVGDDPGDVAGILERNSRRTRVNGLPLRVEHCAGDAVAAGALADSRIVFVTEAGLAAMQQIRDAISERSVLLAGQTAEFLAHPEAMVAFQVEQGRVRIQIDPKRAQAAGLQFSAELLQHAELPASDAEGAP